MVVRSRHWHSESDVPNIEGAHMTDFPALDDIKQVDERKFDAVNLGDADSRNVVFGGQLMAQAVMVADQLHPGRPVRTLFANFARPGHIGQTTTFVADPLVGG